TSKVAAAHAELDRNEPLVALPKNVGCTSVKRDGGELLKWDVSIGVATLNAYLEVLDVEDAVAVLGGEPNGHRKLPISFEQRGRGSPTQCGLNNRIHIADAEPVSRCPDTIHFDVQIWLSKDTKNAEVSDPLYL